MGYVIWAILLSLANVLAWLTLLFALPGTWVIVGLTALFVAFAPPHANFELTWTTVIVAVVLATLGEIIEFIAGAAGAAKQGGSKRGMLLAIGGTMVGSIAGAAIGVPVPLIGPIIGAVGGGAAGAFAGAYLGEAWLGKSSQESFSVGWGALVGRLLGTVGKLAVGAVMVVVIAVDSFT